MTDAGRGSPIELETMYSGRQSRRKVAQLFQLCPSTRPIWPRADLRAGCVSRSWHKPWREPRGKARVAFSSAGVKVSTTAPRPSSRLSLRQAWKPAAGQTHSSRPPRTPLRRPTGRNPPAPEVATPRSAKRDELQAKRASEGSPAPAFRFLPWNCRLRAPLPQRARTRRLVWRPRPAPSGHAGRGPRGIKRASGRAGASDATGLSRAALVDCLHLADWEPQAQTGR